MSRKFLTFFFSFIFVISIGLPAISLLCDDDSEAIILVEKTEEENKESEFTEDAELKFLQITRLNESMTAKSASKKNDRSEKFSSLSHDDVMNPPPEYV